MVKTASSLLILIALVSLLACDGGVDVSGTVYAASEAGVQRSSEVFFDRPPQESMIGSPIIATVVLYPRVDPDRPDEIPGFGFGQFETVTKSDGSFEVGSTCAPFGNLPMMIEFRADGYKSVLHRFVHYSDDNPTMHHQAIAILAPDTSDGGE